MATNKNIHIVIQGSFRCIFANIKGVKDFSKSEKFVTWKQQIIEKEEIAKNPLRLLFTLEDKGRIHNLSKDTMITYTFKKSEVGKYIKFYAYVENFETIQQSTIFYVEDKCNTNIRIRGVGRIDSDSSEVAVGQKIKLKVNEYNVSENKVSDSVKKNIKWMIKVGNEADERLFIDGLVVTGDEIEFSVPEEWAEKKILFMPYLNIHSPKISTELNSVGRVVDIKILTSLHKGSTNDSTGKEQDGLIYGESYEFEAVFSSAIEKPKNENDIKWEYSYYNEEAGEKIVKMASGKKLKIKVDDLDMLGKQVELLVYVGEKNINNPLSRSLPLWIHYRFRFISRKNVLDQLAVRKQSPWAVNQGGTPLCGMASVFYLFAKYRGVDYEKTIADLHRVGKATYNGYTIEPFKGKVRIPNFIPGVPAQQKYVDTSDMMYNMNPKAGNYPSSTPETDWLALAVTRSKESTWIPFVTTLVYSGQKENFNEEQLLGVNWPSMLASVCEKLLGYKNVRQIDLGSLSIASVKLPEVREKLLRRKPVDTIKKLIELDKFHRSGHDILMMIDSDMLHGRVSSNFSDIFNKLHWVVYEGNLKMFDKNRNITSDPNIVWSVKFDVFTWGEPIKNSRISQPINGISIDSFHSTYFGYIDCWNTEFKRM